MEFRILAKLIYWRIRKRQKEKKKERKKKKVTQANLDKYLRSPPLCRKTPSVLMLKPLKAYEVLSRQQGN